MYNLRLSKILNFVIGTCASCKVHLGFWLNLNARIRVSRGRVSASSAGDFDLNLGRVLRSSQTEDYKMSICWLFAKHSTLNSKCKDSSTGMQNNVSR